MTTGRSPHDPEFVAAWQAFLRDVGAEVIFETSRFWVDRVTATDAGYALRQVMGPDEFHSHVDDVPSFSAGDDAYIFLWQSPSGDPPQECRAL